MTHTGQPLAEVFGHLITDQTGTTVWISNVLGSDEKHSSPDDEGTGYRQGLVLVG